MKKYFTMYWLIKKSPFKFHNFCPSLQNQTFCRHFVPLFVQFGAIFHVCSMALRTCLALNLADVDADHTPIWLAMHCFNAIGNCLQNQISMSKQQIWWTSMLMKMIKQFIKREWDKKHTFSRLLALNENGKQKEVF